MIVPPDGAKCRAYVVATLSDGTRWSATLEDGHRQQVITDDGLIEGKCIFRPATYVEGAPPPEVVMVKYIDGQGLTVRIVVTPTWQAHYTYQGIPMP